MAGPRRIRVDDLQIDATPEHDLPAEVETTDHPIEEGANPTDHARALPEKWNGTCVISSVPVDETDRNQRGAFAAFGTGGYAEEVYDKFRKMKDARQLHVITLPNMRLENMLLTSLSRMWRAQYGEAAYFKVGFKQIRLVQSGTAQFVTAPQQVNTDKPVKKEKQSKKQGEDSTEKRKSALKRMTDGLGLTTEGSGVAP